MPDLFDPRSSIFSVGQVAEMLGVQSAFVRRLDTEGVVRPSRSAGGQRRYSQIEVQRIEQVAAMADDGHNLHGIRRILALESELTELREQIHRLEAARDERGRGGNS